MIDLRTTGSSQASFPAPPPLNRNNPMQPSPANPKMPAAILSIIFINGGRNSFVNQDFPSLSRKIFYFAGGVAASQNPIASAKFLRDPRSDIRRLTSDF